MEAIDEIRTLINEDSSAKVYILGARMYAMHMSALLEKHCGIKHFCYVLEDFDNGIETALVKKDSIISLTDYLNNYTENSIFISGSQKFVKKYGELIPKLYHIVYGWVNDKPVEWSKSFVEKNIEMFYETYGILADDTSKKLMIEWIKANLTGQVEHLYELKTDGQYFNDLTASANIDTYIDCGAYDGDTILSFKEAFSEYRRIVAFEPDENNYNKLMERINSGKIENVEKYRAGAYYRNGETYFNDTDQDITARYMTHAGNGTRIEVRSIDSVNVHRNVHSQVSLIKMDIEGSELDALMGARKTIKSDNPILAICVYHKCDDLIVIPQYIFDIAGRNTYKFYLRYHGSSLTELVLYAVPA